MYVINILIEIYSFLTFLQFIFKSVIILNYGAADEIIHCHTCIQ